MNDTLWEHQQDARRALRTVVSDPRLGVSALSDPQALSTALKDLLPPIFREASVLVTAAGAGAAQILHDHVAQGMELAAALASTASALADRTALTPEARTWVAGELAVVLGLVPEGTSRPPETDATMLGSAPVTRLPGDSAAGSATGPRSSGRTSSPRRSAKPWAITAAAVLAAAVAATGITVFLPHGTTKARPRTAGIEPLSKIIRPDVFVTSCIPVPKLGMASMVAALRCETRAPTISLTGYQLGNATNFKAAIAFLNQVIGWDSTGASRRCPPASAFGQGVQALHGVAGFTRTAHRGQILECGPDNTANSEGVPNFYLWTIPADRVILLARDTFTIPCYSDRCANRASRASFERLQAWFVKFRYG